VFEFNTSSNGHGGAIGVRDAAPDIRDSHFINNTAHRNGGALYFRNSRNAVAGPGNHFEGNRGCGGNDLAAWATEIQTINAGGNVFADGSAMTEAWVMPPDAFDVTGHTSALIPIASNVYVSPNGDDATNTGLTPDSPFRTIRHALSQIQTGTNLTIYLAPGLYSADTSGETFPLPMLSGVSISGPTRFDEALNAVNLFEHNERINRDSLKTVLLLLRDLFENDTAGELTEPELRLFFEHTAVLDAGSTRGAVRAETVSNTGLSNVVLTGSVGPGLYARAAEADVASLTITSFSNADNGAGMFFDTGAAFQVTDSFIADNHAQVSGGGLYLVSGLSTFTGCVFADNSAVFAGGAVFNQTGSTVFDGCHFSGNNAARGGAVRIDGGSPIIAAGNAGPNEFGGNSGARGANLSSSRFPATPYIATGNVFDVSPESAWSVSPGDAFDVTGYSVTGPDVMPGAVVYVSPDGDNDNDGLTPATAFRTITHALRRVTGSLGQPAEVIVAEGDYDAAGDEQFPLNIPPFVRVVGAHQNSTRILADSGIAVDMYHSEDSVLQFVTVSSAAGQGIVVEQCDPDIISVAVVDCSAEVNGAGMGLLNASPLISNCAFEGNTTTRQGGAIHAGTGSQPLIHGSVFIGNTAVQFGGAVLSGFNAHVTIDDCLFADNVTHRDGGAVAAYFGTVTVGATHFLQNRARLTGGAVYVSQTGSDLAMTPNIFYDNAAVLGADLAAADVFDIPIPASTNTFSGVFLSEYNVSPQPAFDLSGSSGADPINSDMFVAPSGDDDNSGTTPSEPVRTIRAALSRIVADTNANETLTVYLAEGEYALADEPWPGTLPLLSGITVRGSSAEDVIIDAGGIGPVTGAFWGNRVEQTALKHLTIRNSLAAAVNASFSTMWIDQCRFMNNLSPAQGGAIAFSGGFLSLRNSLFSGNSASTSGGALDIRQYGSLLMANCDFINNQASGPGGAVSTWLTAGRAHNCRFMDNSAASGGAWYSRQDRDFVQTGSEIMGNRAGKAGGLGTFGGNFTLIDCLVAENSAIPIDERNGYGGGVLFESGSGTITSSTIAENDAGGFTRIAGGGLAVIGSNATATVRDTIIWTNHALKGNNIAVAWRWNPASATISWSVPGDGSSESVYVATGATLTTGPGNMYSDPLFVGDNHNAGLQSSFIASSLFYTRYGRELSLPYTLSSVRSGQEQDSPCLNAGSEPVGYAVYMTPDGIEFMQNRSVESGSWPDEGVLDMGYHAPLPECINSGDVTGDGQVTWDDVALIFDYALGLDFPSHYSVFCAADVNGDGEITAEDAMMAGTALLPFDLEPSPSTLNLERGRQTTFEL
jgi:predicted outer membrane repeat protein